MSTVTMQELELETAELLPSRETLCVPRCHPCEPCFKVCVDIHVSLGGCL